MYIPLKEGMIGNQATDIYSHSVIVEIISFLSVRYGSLRMTLTLWIEIRL